MQQDAMIRKMAYVCRRERMIFPVEMARSSQYPRIMPPWGCMVEAISLMMGSIAKAKRVMERGQPCLTPQRKRIVKVRVWLIKMVWRLFL